MENFIAIEVQTANHSKSSICAIGMVIVKQGQIVERIYRLVRPTPNFYAGWAVALHGITYEDTINEPDFVDVWAELAPKIRRNVIVAHNVDFIEGCLIAAHEVYAMRYPKYVYFCTIRSSRSINPELPSHDLQTIAARAGYILESEKNALANAEASAAIAMSLPSDEVSRRTPRVSKRALTVLSDKKVKPRIILEAEERIRAERRANKLISTDPIPVDDPSER